MSTQVQKTILLVEDESIIAMTEKITLEKFGYRVLVAHRGEEAVATVAATPGIDLILMDIDLGKGMDGTEAAALILKERDLPVVFLSSHMEPEIVARTEKITSYGYVVKNSSSTVLDASIKMAFKLFDAKISEKKKELALSQSNELISKLARLVPGVIFQFRLDPDGRSAFPYASPGMNDINEVSPEEVREDATPVFARLHPDDYDHVVGAIHASSLTLNTFYCEFRVLLPRQGLRWHLSQAHPERLADGSTLWHGIISDITERKLAEEALRASEERYRTLFDFSPTAILLTAPDSRILTANKAACRLFEMTEEEIKQSGRSGLLDIADPKLAPALEELDSSGKFYGELTLIRKNGVRFPGEVSSVVFKDKDGSPRTSMIIHDISDRKRTEEVIQNTLRFQQALMDAVPSPIFYKDANRVYIGGNKAFERYVGLTREQFIGKTVYDIAPAELAEKYDKADKELLENQVMQTYEASVAHADGTTHEVVFHKAVFTNIEGHLAGLIGVILDITERKQAQQALQENNSRLELAMQAADMGWWEMDLPGGHVSFAKRKAEMLGYPTEKFKHYQDFVALVHPDDQEKALAAMRGHLDGSLPRYEVDYRIAASSGETVWFHDIGSVGKRDADGKPLNVTGLVINISDRKRAEAEIQRQLTEKEILLKEVHHRIKNNFASVSGLLSLHMQAITSPEAVAALQDAIGRVDSMRLLYDKLLLSGDFQDASTKNYVESLAASVVSLFPDLAKVKLNLDVDDFKLDPKRLFPLGIIINELLTNIMKYAFAGKNSGTINLSLAKDGSRVTLILQDDGPGFPDGFDINESRGFGLMLVKMLSNQLGGSFTMEKHAGARCRVEFPA